MNLNEINETIESYENLCCKNCETGECDSCNINYYLEDLMNERDILIYGTIIK